jgi:hypothetical protein
VSCVLSRAGSAPRGVLRARGNDIASRIRTGTHGGSSVLSVLSPSPNSWSSESGCLAIGEACKASSWSSSQSWSVGTKLRYPVRFLAVVSLGGLGGGGPTVSGGGLTMFRLLPALPRALPSAFGLADGLRLAFGFFAAATSLAIVDVSACCQP